MPRFSSIKALVVKIKNRCSSKYQKRTRTVSHPTEYQSYFQAVYAGNWGHTQDYDDSLESLAQYRLLLDYNVLDIDDPQMPDVILPEFESIDDLINEGDYDSAVARLEKDWEQVADLFGEGSEVTEIIRERIRHFAEQCPSV